MFTKRIIPCLDVNKGRVVKGVNFVNLKDAGDPVEIARAYDAAGADELVFLDITASCEERDTVVDMVRACLLYTSIPRILNSSATQTAVSGGSMQIRRMQEFLSKSFNASEPEKSIPALYFPDSKFIFLLFLCSRAGETQGGTPPASRRLVSYAVLYCSSTTVLWYLAFSSRRAFHSSFSSSSL